jgi:dUTPase
MKCIRRSDPSLWKWVGKIRSIYTTAADMFTQIAPLFGLAHHIDVGGGFVDYRGNVCMFLFNHFNNPFQIYHADRIAQLIGKNILYPTIKEVKELDNKERDTKEFGLTGGN